MGDNILSEQAGMRGMRGMRPLNTARKPRARTLKSGRGVTGLKKGESGETVHFTKSTT